ncbi:MAG: NAD(P)/FAD-dependent oxidoreductase [Candidatus Hodarchaeales archaeon]
MVNTDYDVVIIGGGPSGLSAARKCAEYGNLKVAVFEEHPEIGEPLSCGEGISVHKLNELGIPFSVKTLNNKNDPTSYVERTVRLQRFFFGQSGVSVSQLETVTIDRPMFDKYLAKTAETKGVEVLTSHSVRNLDFNIDSVQIKVKINNQDETNFLAKVVVAADGPVSRMTRIAGLTPPAKYVQGMEKKIKGIYTDALDFHFDFNLCPGGYGWVFPKKRETNIGIVCQPGLEPNKRLETFISRIIKQEEYESIRTIAGIIPASGPIEKPYRERFLVVGDAGGFTNSIFYGGIAIGIHTGYLAAQVINHSFKKNDFSEKSFSNYAHLLDCMPYTDPAIQKAHDIMYDRFGQDYLEKAGKLLDGRDITHLGKVGKMILTAKVITSPLRKHLDELRAIMRGFKYSRDWGF